MSLGDPGSKAGDQVKEGGNTLPREHRRNRDDDEKQVLLEGNAQGADDPGHLGVVKKPVAGSNRIRIPQHEHGDDDEER